ncbi:hypothetical protein B0H17DRAFT_1332780 [Mycena rosella]|uniref:SET domain-containing protein n=1 Tax=Mycena rosella TaxID=1033263 RepID=A0AAD7DBE6_MYCRO|nr:hypothetical protein B0H17DRAFT_1332780 [Mycena rosella]
MKRGFLNNTKARAKISGGDSEAPKKKTESGSTSGPSYYKAKYGVVEHAGLPEGYKLADLDVKELDPHRDPRTLPENLFLVTSLPIPLEAPAAAGTDRATACMLQSTTKAQILSTPGFPRPVPRPPAVRHRIGPAPGMDLGAFSTARIQRGEVILSERALLIAPGHLFGDDDYPSSFSEAQIQQAILVQAEQYLKVAFDRMDPEDKTAYMALANSHLQDGSGPILGIMRTNGVGAGPLTRPGTPPMPYSAVCKEISRLNHSCCPNTTALFDMPSFSFRLFALRDIASGEELTYPYIDVTAPAAERQKALEPYGFRCTCPACRDPTSDARR